MIKLPNIEKSKENILLKQEISKLNRAKTLRKNKTSKGE